MQHSKQNAWELHEVKLLPWCLITKQFTTLKNTTKSPFSILRTP